jgi:predicted RNase H-like HicB family nuclease
MMGVIDSHTFGATVEEAQANLREAIALHVESILEDGSPGV